MITKIGGGGVLPAGYVECKYLESNGRQTIVTGIVPDDSNRITCKVVVYVKTGAICGSTQRGAPYPVNSIALSYSRVLFSNKKINFDYNTGEVLNISIETTDGVPILIINGQEFTSLPDTNSSVQFLTIFNSNYGGGMRGRMYYFSIADKLFLIPCLDPNGKPCMYDTISQAPFYNTGAGEFGYETKDGRYVAPV